MCVAAADADNVDKGRPRVADRLEDLAQAALATVLDDDAGCGGDVGLEVGIGAPRVAGEDVDPGVMEPSGDRLALDEEFDLEAGRQGFIKHPDDQFGLADGETPHSIR